MDKLIDYLNYIPLGVTETKPIKNACVVLEGGAFRTTHQEGVLDALMLNGINTEAAVGTSAGALNAYNYIQGNIGRSGYMNIKFRNDKRYVSVKNYIKNGSIIGFPFMFYSTMCLGNDMENSRRCVAAVTNCETGEAEYLEDTNCSSLYKALAASSSVPYLSKMVKLDGKKYLDGGCADRIPYKWALENNYEKIIVIKSRPASYRESRESSRIIRRGEYLIYKNYPELAEKIINKDVYYNDELDELERLKKEGRILLIEPKGPVEVSTLTKDVNKLASFYFEGLSDGYRMIDEINEYLKSA